ncbi:hypothetical protein [Plantibacter flavus]|uniref:hypothetical protein n=1 Tax=Plantibacter flavus TaxID=150123 RepID=UPI003398DDA8
MEDSSSPERVKFYGPHDLAAGWHADRAVSLIQEYGTGRKIRSLNDALELHNALAFEEYAVFPSSVDQQEQESLRPIARDCRRRIASIFAGLDASNVGSLLAGFAIQYASDLILLLGRHQVAKNVGRQELFDALLEVRMPLTVMLGDRKFVDYYDRQLRGELLADPRNGQILVSRRLIKGSRSSIHVPTSLSSEDSHQLLRAYIDSLSPHPNYVQAIAQANDNDAFGITPKLRLQAKKRYEALMHELFDDDSNSLMKSGYGVRLDPNQRHPVVDNIHHTDDGMTHIRSFSEHHLSSSMDPARVLNNFASVIGYLDHNGLLTMPAFRSRASAFEAIFISGKDAYPAGAVFKHLDSLTFLGTHLYSEFLAQREVEVEEAVAWLFREHLVNEHGAANFYYAPSSPNNSFLERCRHLVAEMESISKQFALYCDECELDPELLRMTSGSRPWADVPSLVEKKYLEPSPESDCERVLGALFGSQSGLTYVDEELQAESFVELVTENELFYESLHPYQKGTVDWLSSEGLVAIEDGVIEFAQPLQILVLSDVYERDAAAYAHYGTDESAAARTLVDKGWLAFKSNLLTSAESSYFNFFLNRSEFSNGPDLRNSYAHGTNANPEDLSAHEQSYVQLLRMLVSLVLKILDDFQRSDANKSTPSL